MGPSIAVSTFPSYMAVTIAENAAPATTFAGALITRVAWPDPQLSDTNVAITALNAHSIRTVATRHPRRPDVNDTSARKPMKPARAFDTPSSVMKQWIVAAPCRPTREPDENSAIKAATESTRHARSNVVDHCLTAAAEYPCHTYSSASGSVCCFTAWSTCPALRANTN